MAKEVRHDKSCKFRLYPNEEQRVLIAKTFGCCRWVYNWGLAMRKKAWEEEKKSIGWKELQNMLPAMKKAPDTEWLKEVDSKALISSIRCMDVAYKTSSNYIVAILALRLNMIETNPIKHSKGSNTLMTEVSCSYPNLEG